MVNFLLLLLAFALIFNISMRYAPTNRNLFYLLITYFLIVSIAGFINSNIVTFYSFDRDWYFLEGRARVFLYRDLALGEMLAEAKGRQFYAIFVAFSYSLFGIDEFPLVILNAVLSTLVILFTFKIALSFGADNRFAFLAALFIALFPPVAAYAIQPSREPLVLLCFSAGLYTCLRYTVTQNPAHFLVSMACLAVASIIHTVMIVALFGFLVIAIRSTLRRRGLNRTAKDRRALSIIIVSLLGVPALVLFISSGAGFAKLGGDLSAVDLDLLESRFETRDADNRAGYFNASELRARSLPEHIRTIPSRVWLFSTKPYPSDIGAIVDIAALGLNILALAFVYAIFKAGGGWLKGKSRRTVLMVVASMYVILAIGTNNWGTAVRHKTKLVVPCVAIYAALLTERSYRRRRVRSLAPLTTIAGAPPGA